MVNSSPLGLPLATALERNEALGSLMQRMKGSKDRYQAISHLLPVGMMGDVRPGPLDESAWVLLVSNASAAAKLRQLLPALQTALAAAGFAQPAISIKVRPRE